MGFYRGDGLRGDYYRGDYYRGDPFLGALLGAAGKKIAKWGASRLFGKAAGKAGKAVGALATAARTHAPTIVRDVAVGSLGFQMGQQSGARIPVDEYGAILPGPGWGEPRRRRMNPLNPKALRRALRRAQGFEKFARKTVNALYKTVDGRRVKTFKKRGK